MDETVNDNATPVDGLASKGSSFKDLDHVSEPAPSWSKLLLLGDWTSVCSGCTYPPESLGNEYAQVWRERLVGVLTQVAKHNRAERHELTPEDEQERIHCYQILHEYGMIRVSAADSPVRPDVKYQTAGSFSLKQEITRWLEDTQQAIWIMRNESRRKFAVQQMDRMFDLNGPLSNLLSLSAAVDLNSGDSPPPAEIAEAVYAQLARISNNFDQQESERFARNLRTNRQSFVLTINDDVVSKYLPSGATSSEWIKGLLRHMPRPFMHLIDAIRFVRHSDPRFYSLRDQSRHNTYAGLWMGDKYQMEVYVDVIERAVLSRGIPEGELSAHVMSTIEAVIAHEYGHNAMAVALTLTDIRDWIRVVRAENCAVTPYVADMQQHETKEAAYEEDFCESLVVFLTHPDKLKSSAPLRYSYFQKLAQRYGDDKIAV